MSFHIIDIETNAIDNPDKLWCIVVKNLDTDEIKTWSSPEGTAGGADFVEYCKGVSAWVGHNIIHYDLPIIKRFIPAFTFSEEQVIDTLVCCRLFNFGVDGGNSLEAWGNRLKFPKGNFSNFSSYSEEMLAYCIQDVQLTGKLYAILEPYLKSSTHRKSLRTEHRTAFLCNTLHNTGFHFDKLRADSLHLAISRSKHALDKYLSHGFPPRVKFHSVVNPRITRTGSLSRTDFRWLEDSSDLSIFSGGPFSRIVYEVFNPRSPKQCVERLWDCGWKPTDKTKGYLAAERELQWLDRRARGYSKRDNSGSPEGVSDTERKLRAKLDKFKIYGWKINETNLSTLPREAPEEAQKLVEFLILASRQSTLEEWFGAYNEETGRIHGTFNHIGAWTHRMSHTNPNMANIPGHDSAYGDEMRSLWTAPPGKYLVGVDADAIQLRILAHYMNDKDFIKALTEGSKDDGTDAHTLNQRALGSVCRSRDVAKTFIYAFLLGAGTGKLAEILGCSLPEAKEATEAFLSYYPGLRTLKDYRIPADASRGYFVGLDGRIVVCDSEHLMLAGYLQNGESVIMKTANLIWVDKLKKEGIPFKQVNFVHDEWQTEVNSLTDAEIVGKMKVSAIVEAGIQLKLNCPLAGNYKIGTNWLETH